MFIELECVCVNGEGDRVRLQKRTVHMFLFLSKCTVAGTWYSLGVYHVR